MSSHSRAAWLAGGARAAETRTHGMMHGRKEELTRHLQGRLLLERWKRRKKLIGRAVRVGHHVAGGSGRAERSRADGAWSLVDTSRIEADDFSEGAAPAFDVHLQDRVRPRVSCALLVERITRAHVRVAGRCIHGRRRPNAASRAAAIGGKRPARPRQSAGCPPPRARANRRPRAMNSPRT